MNAEMEEYGLGEKEKRMSAHQMWEKMGFHSNDFQFWNKNVKKGKKQADVSATTIFSSKTQIGFLKAILEGIMGTNERQYFIFLLPTNIITITGKQIGTHKCRKSLLKDKANDKAPINHIIKFKFFFLCLFQPGNALGSF